MDGERCCVIVEHVEWEAVQRWEVCGGYERGRQNEVGLCSLEIATG